MLLKISKFLNSNEVVTFNYITPDLARTIITQEFPTLTDVEPFVTGENCIIFDVGGVLLRIGKDHPAP